MTSNKRFMNEADEILSMIKVNTIPLEKWSLGDLQTRLQTACQGVNISHPTVGDTFKKDDVVIMIQVNGFAVAACVAILRNTDKEGKMYDITTICSAESQNLQEYLILEAKRYARQRGVLLVKVSSSISPMIASDKKTLSVETDVLLGLFEKKIRTVKEFYADEIHSGEEETNMKRDFYRDFCRSEIGETFIHELIESGKPFSDPDYPNDVSDGKYPDTNYVITVSFAGKILAVAFVDVEKSYLKLELICARKSTGLGGHMMKYVEDFAISKNLELVKLEARLNLVDWYEAHGFEIYGASRDLSLQYLKKRVIARLPKKVRRSIK